MDEGDQYEIAPGVHCEHFAWGARLEGRRGALISAGLADDDWFAQLPKRVQRQWPGGIFVSTKRLAAGVFRVDISTAHYSEKCPGVARDGGRKPVAWADCAWQPRNVREA